MHFMDNINLEDSTNNTIFIFTGSFLFFLFGLYSFEPDFIKTTNKKNGNSYVNMKLLISLSTLSAFSITVVMFLIKHKVPIEKKHVSDVRMMSLFS